MKLSGVFVRFSGSFSGQRLRSVYALYVFPWFAFGKKLGVDRDSMVSLIHTRLPLVYVLRKKLDQLYYLAQGNKLLKEHEHQPCRGYAAHNLTGGRNFGSEHQSNKLGELEQDKRLRFQTIEGGQRDAGLKSSNLGAFLSRSQYAYLDDFRPMLLCHFSATELKGKLKAFEKLLRTTSLVAGEKRTNTLDLTF
jgi:hypothetical protein